MSTPSTGQQGLVRVAHRAEPQTPRPPAQRTDSHLLPPGPAGPRLPPEPIEHDLATLSLPELRTLRRDAQQDEADLSYVRRLLQGRIDILRAELLRRSPTGAGSLLARLPHAPAVDP